MISTTVEILSYLTVAMILPLGASILLHSRDGVITCLFLAASLWLGAWAWDFHDAAVHAMSVNG